ncbi:MAG TPA: RIP metalloprotease RseP [Thermoanaerobaculia bacterium]|nr:RIP metalloprotease RseP [Thermoanaerobaculia bacterium]
MIATNILTNLVAFVLVLGFLIFAHEAGHFFAAKSFGVRVLVFSFGFGKRLFGFRRGDTDYRVSLVPLGGYVRMAGDTPEDNTPGDPDEFLSRPKWQRFLILLAGPFMNLVIAIVFIAAINMIGTEVFVTPPVVGEVVAGTPAERSGLQSGDRIVSVDGDAVKDFDDFKMAIITHAGTPIRVEYLRKGVRNVTTLTPKTENSEYGPVGKAGLYPWIEPVVGRVQSGSPAARAGLQPGDRITWTNGTVITDLTQLDSIFDGAKGQPIRMDVLRDEKTLQLTIPPEKTGQPLAYRGFIPPTQLHKLPLGPAFQESFAENWKFLRFTAITLNRLVRGEGSVREFSGPISIARISGEMLRSGWVAIVGFMAVISLQLGIMNLLPIPILDGGHIAILLVEAAARRDLSIRAKERIMQLGFAVLAALMIVVLYNDVITNVLLMRKG